MNIIQEVDELVDVVDEQDRVVTTMWRSQVIDKEIKYMRVVLGFLTDGTGRVCLLRRASHKKQLPNRYSLVGGGVQSGESYDQAFIREVQEEINIDITTLQYKRHGLVAPSDLGGAQNLFKMIYEVSVTQADIDFNAHDFSGYMWATPQEFLAMDQTESSLAYDLPVFFKRFYLGQ